HRSYPSAMDSAGSRISVSIYSRRRLRMVLRSGPKSVPFLPPIWWHVEQLLRNTASPCAGLPGLPNPDLYLLITSFLDLSIGVFENIFLARFRISSFSFIMSEICW